jgi:predicted aspartyl protease
MQRPLSRRYSPPAPMVYARVSAPDGGRVRLVEAQIDTGADLCALPRRIAADLELRAVRRIRAAGYEGQGEKMILYVADLDIEGLQFPQVELLPTRLSFAILGRPVLQHLVVQIDGPRQILRLTRPRPSKRP